MRKEWTKYLNQDVEDLQTISPKWAYGRNYRKSHYTQDFLKEGCTIYHAKLSDIIEHTDFGEVQFDRLFTGEETNDRRIAQIIYRWDNNQFVDPPNICFVSGNKIIRFGDGRHRIKAAYFLAQIQIPLIIPNEDVPFIKEIVNRSRRPL